jgi:hypothetical protein
MRRVSAPHSWSVHHNFACGGRVKEGGPAPPSPGCADFTIMLECTPESGNCNSVCTLWSRTADVSLPYGIGYRVQ